MVKPHVARDMLMKVFYEKQQPILDPGSDLDDDLPTILKLTASLSKQNTSLKELNDDPSLPEFPYQAMSR